MKYKECMNNEKAINNELSNKLKEIEKRLDMNDKHFKKELNKERDDNRKLLIQNQKLMLLNLLIRPYILRILHIYLIDTLINQTQFEPLVLKSNYNFFMI